MVFGEATCDVALLESASIRTLKRGTKVVEEEQGMGWMDESFASLRKAPTHHCVFDRVHLAISEDETTFEANPDFEYFSIEGVLSYIGFCDDFGPMSLGTIYEFCFILDEQLQKFPSKSIAMRPARRFGSITNAVFLMGAYMIMRLNYQLDAVMKCMLPFRSRVIPYRDVSPGKQNFNLYLEDCLGGLIRAKELGWVRFEPGGFNLVEYENMDSPLNADLHEIVPGKFIAMKGPKHLPDGRSWIDVKNADGSFSHREFSPAHYAEILRRFDVKAVVRLNAPEYEKKDFADEGIAVADLFFEDCSSPSSEVVAKFLEIAERVPGAIAVHCKAGLGRTGTLIALYLMKHHAFTAREAMGWLRVVRPGSVIGPQQAFLCEKEAVMLRVSEAVRRAGDREKRAPLACDTVASLDAAISGVTREVDARARAFRDSRRAGTGKAVRRAPAASEGCGGEGRRDSAQDVLASHVSSAATRRSALRATVSASCVYDPR